MRSRLTFAALGGLLVFCGCAHHTQSIVSQSSPGKMAKIGHYSDAQRAQLAEQAVYDTKYIKTADAEAAINQKPSNVLAHERLGEDLLGRDDARAIGEFRWVLRKQPNNRRVEYLLADRLGRAGNKAEARDILTRLAVEDDVWGSAARRRLQPLTP